MHVQGLDYIEFLRDRSQYLWNNACCSRRRAWIAISVAPGKINAVNQKLDEMREASRDEEAGLRSLNVLPNSADLFGIIEAKNGDTADGNKTIDEIIREIRAVDGVSAVEQRDTEM